MNLHVRERARTTRFFHGRHKIARALERSHLTTWSDNLRKIDGRVTGARADIEHAFSGGDSGFLPAIQNDRAPDAMLQAEPRNFFLVRAENVILLSGHEMIVAN